MNSANESVAKVLLINGENNALVLTVGVYVARPDKSFKPDLPGGMVDPGESELDAVQRELREETGIALPKEAFSLAYTKTEFFDGEKKSVNKFLYIAFTDKVPAVKLSWEHASYEWVSLEQLQNNIELRPFYKEAVTYCFENKLLTA
jgi:8-oxo-dGTP pyrophosphatase MutT (NUDIX family)